MWVRIARFEGTEDNWDERINEVRKRMQATPEEGSPMHEVRPLIKRGMMLVDRKNSRGAGVMFCESEDDLKRVDEAMNQMTRPHGGGERASVEMYEIAVDEQPS